ncbi:MAG: hypothetical protein M1344_04675, partial [Candidatus Thermoplasmatota archaeon]|nr:hypothetical protein [Candidatus Thermoplasmatota archaeon]
MPTTPGYASKEEAIEAVSRMKKVLDASPNKTLPPIYISSISEILSESKDKIRAMFIEEVAEKCPELMGLFDSVKVKSVPEKKTKSKDKVNS